MNYLKTKITSLLVRDNLRHARFQEALLAVMRANGGRIDFNTMVRVEASMSFDGGQFTDIESIELEGVLAKANGYPLQMQDGAEFPSECLIESMFEDLSEDNLKAFLEAVVEQDLCGPHDSESKKVKTSDGYLLILKGGVWTDGDMQFKDLDGWPVDDLGVKLEGTEAS